MTPEVEARFAELQALVLEQGSRILDLEKENQKLKRESQLNGKESHYLNLRFLTTI